MVKPAVPDMGKQLLESYSVSLESWNFTVLSTADLEIYIFFNNTLWFIFHELKKGIPILCEFLRLCKTA